MILVPSHSRKRERGQEREHTRFDAAFSANSLHIMGWPEVEACFAGLGSALADDATLVVYGPFNYGGQFTSEGNRQLDSWARDTYPGAGLRDFEAICALAADHCLDFKGDNQMPANNRLLEFRQLPN